MWTCILVWLLEKTSGVLVRLWAYPVHRKIEARSEILCLILEFRGGYQIGKGTGNLDF